MNFTAIAHPPGHDDNYRMAGFRQSEMEELAKGYTGAALMYEHGKAGIAKPVGKIAKALVAETGDMRIHGVIDDTPEGKWVFDQMKRGELLSVSVNAKLDLDKDATRVCQITTGSEISLVGTPGIAGSDVLSFIEHNPDGSRQVYLRNNQLERNMSAPTTVVRAEPVEATAPPAAAPVAAAPIVPAAPVVPTPEQQLLAMRNAVMAVARPGETLESVVARLETQRQNDEAREKQQADEKAAAMLKEQNALLAKLSDPNTRAYVAEYGKRCKMEADELADSFAKTLESPAGFVTVGMCASLSERCGNVEQLNRDLEANRLRLEAENASLKQKLDVQATKIQDKERFQPTAAAKLLRQAFNAPVVSQQVAPQQQVTMNASGTPAVQASANPYEYALAFGEKYIRGAGTDLSKIAVTPQDLAGRR